MARLKIILITAALIVVVVAALAIYPGVIRPAFSREKSTVEIIVVDNQGSAISNAEITIGEYGFRYLFPMPFVSPSWCSSKKITTYSSSDSGLCTVTFYDEQIELVRLCIAGNCIPAKSEVPQIGNLQNAYYTSEYITWWTNSQDATPLAKPLIDQSTSPVLVQRGYIEGHILGHKLRIIVTKQ